MIYIDVSNKYECKIDTDTATATATATLEGRRKGKERRGQIIRYIYC